MNRKVILCKVLSVILMAFMIFSTLSGTAFAITPSGVTDFETGTYTDSGNASAVTTPVRKMVAAMTKVIQYIGYGIAIIMLIWLAIKYISAAPNEKAEIKKSVTIYVVGAIILFSAATLVGYIGTFAQANISS